MNIKEKTIGIINAILEEAEFDDYPHAFQLKIKSLVTNEISLDDVERILRKLRSEGGFCINSEASNIDLEQSGSISEATCLQCHMNYLNLLTLRSKFQGITPKPIICRDALGTIAGVVAQNGTHKRIDEKFEEVGVGRELVDTSGSKGSKVQDLFCFLSGSPEEKHHQLLFRLIEGFIHPLWFGSSYSAASATKATNEALKYDEYCLYEHKVQKLTPEIQKHLEEQEKQAKKKEEESWSNLNTDVFSNFFGGSFQQQKQNSQMQSQTQAQMQKQEQVQKTHVPVHVTVNNNIPSQTPNTNTQTTSEEKKEKKEADYKMEFDHIHSRLKYGTKSCSIPRNGNNQRGSSIEFVVCDRIFNQIKKFPVEWCKFYEDSFGDFSDRKDDAKKKKSLVDAICRINGRTRQSFGFDVIAYDRDWIFKPQV